MDINSILDRVEALIAERGVSATAISRAATGNADTIRNWLRARREGRQISPRMDTIAAVARAMPGFGLMPGDVLTVVFGPPPMPGDMTLVQVPDTTGGGGVFMLRRKIPGGFLSDDGQSIDAEQPGARCGIVREMRRRIGRPGI